MNKVDKVLPSDSEFLSLISNKIIDNKSLSGIFCSHCYSYICIKIDRKPDGIFVNSKCENGHKEFKPLQNFMNNYLKGYIKDCQICYSHININELYYCYSCSSKNIICIECRDKYHPKSNIKNEKSHITIRFTLKSNYCPLHNDINTYYFIYIAKNICTTYMIKRTFIHMLSQILILIKLFILKIE